VTEEPSRASATDTVKAAYGVLRQPAFLWAPIALAVVTSLLLLALPAVPQTQPSFTTQAEIDAFMRAFIPTVILTAVVGTLLGQLSASVDFQLARQYVERSTARPFAPGIIGLAWRFFLQTLVYLVLMAVGFLLLFVAFLILEALAGGNLAMILVAVGGTVAIIFVSVRLTLAPVLLLWGAGPIAATRESWRLTRGRAGLVFRWILVTGVLIGVPVVVIQAVTGWILGAVNLAFAATLVGTVLVAPFAVVGAIVFVHLTRLLSDAGEPASSVDDPTVEETRFATPEARPT
jgi:hypothetical protein